MAITVPKYRELYNSIISDLKTKLGITTSIAPKTTLPAQASVAAGKQKIFYTALAKVNENVFPDLADEETLRRFGRLKLGRDITPATAGEYTISVTGEVGATIDINKTYSNSGDYLFIVDSTFTFTATTGTLTVRALTVGPEATLTAGDEIELTSKIANVDSLATVVSVDVIPVSEETVDEYRVNVVDSFRLQPQGGARSDYRRWTENVPGVRSVYPYVVSGNINQINLFIEAFPEDSDPVGTGIPTTAIKAATKASIEPEKIPMTVYQINYLDAIALDVDVAIVGLSDTGKLPSIEALITDYLYAIRPYIGGADSIVDKNMGVMYSSEIQGLIISTGVTFTSVTVSVDSSVITKYEFASGNIPYLNSVTNS